MDYPQLLNLFERSAAIRLLKSNSAPFVIYFFYKQFKHSGHQAAIPVDMFLHQLENALTYHQEGSNPLSQPPQTYLREWIKDGYLREFISDQNNMRMVELTGAIEKVFNWIDDLRDRQFIGTESRLLRIFDLLENIAIRSTDDPSQLLAQLERQRDEIDDQIKRIRTTGKAESLSDTQIREQFIEAENTARNMIGDFREVEEKFREIADGIYTAQLTPDMQKGKVLSKTLDDGDALQESDQGRSFYAFWDFLNAPDRAAQFRSLFEQVTQLPALSGLIRPDSMLRRFVPNLLSAAQRVRTQNSALLERLRRLLDNQTLEENRRLRTLIDTFKRELRDRRNDSLPQRDFWNIEGEPEIVFPVDRPTWKVKTGISIQAHELWRGNISADEAEEELNSIFFINKDNLRANIRDAVGAFEIISLQDLLVLYPIQQGIAELVAYYEIASEEEHHSVLLETADTIYLIRNGDSQQVEISGPRIIFRNM